jgi:ApaG protein
METKQLIEHIKIYAKPHYRPDESKPEENQFVFSYEIRIENKSDIKVKLLRRKWTIINSENEVHEVDGEGVVGLQPEIKPNETFVYSSWCPLNSSWGTMEGIYLMIDEMDQQFEVKIPRFYLTAELKNV